MTFPGTSGYSCPDCSAWVPIGVTHQCQGQGSPWTLSATTDWTSLYLAQIVGLLVKIEEHLHPQIVVQALGDTMTPNDIRRTLGLSEIPVAKPNTNKEKAMAMSDVVSGLLLHELQSARSVRARAISYINELRVQISEHETVVGNANVTVDEIERALSQGGVEIPKEVE